MEDAMEEEDKVTMELNLAVSKRQNLGKALDQIQSQVSSFLSLTLQWKELDEHFESIQKSIEQRFEEVEKRYGEVEGMAERLRTLQKVIFREVDAKSREVEEKESGVKEREREVESREKSAEKGAKEVEWIKKRMEVKRKSLEERRKELELKEEEFESVKEMIDKRIDELEAEEKRLCSMRKSIEERGEEVGLKERELNSMQISIEKRGEEVGLKERDLGLLEKSIEARGKEVELNERELGLKERRIEQRGEEVELKARDLDSRRKSIEERNGEVELKERELDSRIESIEERNEEVVAKERELGSKRESIEERGKEVELKARELDSRQKWIEERNGEIELKERELDSRLESIEERNEEVEMKERELDLRQELIEKRKGEVELEERELGLRKKWMQDQCEQVESIVRALVLLQESVEQRSEEVELRERELASMQESIEQRCKEFDSKQWELDVMQKSINEQYVDVILKERDLCLMRKLIDKRSKEVEAREERVGMVRSLNKECTRELKLKDKEFNIVGETMAPCHKEVELKQKHVESSMEGPFEEAALKDDHLSSVQNKNEVFLQELELKGNQHYLNQKEIEASSNNHELREKQLDVIQELMSDNILHPQVVADPPECFADENKIDSSSADLRFCITMDGKNLQIFLNKRFTGRQSINDEVFIALQMSSDPAKLVLDAMQGFYPPYLKEGDMEFEASVIRRSCILLLQQLRRVSPQIKPHVKAAAMKLAGEWKSKMRPQDENSLEVLGFLQLVATFGLASELNMDEIVNRFQTVAQHRQFPESCQALDLADRVPMSGNPHSQLKTQQLEYSKANYEIDSSFASHLFFSNIYRSMQLLSDEHSVDEYLMLVNAALKMSSNPAKLVLDTLRGFYQLGLEKGSVKFKESEIRGCTFLLEQLKKVSPEINSQVKEEAMKLAIEWKAKFQEEIENSLDVLNFLLLLATYGLESALNGDEAVLLFKAVAQHTEASQLCRELGFVDNISDYVHFLVEKKQQLEAIRYIHAFELDDKLPMVPLLEDHLKCCEKVSRKICKKRNYSSAARGEAADKEIAALKEVIKCIVDYKLESKFLPGDLEKRIIQLEKQKENRKCFAPSPARKDQLQLNSVNKRPRIAVLPEAAQSTSNLIAPESQQTSL